MPYLTISLAIFHNKKSAKDIILSQLSHREKVANLVWKLAHAGAAKLLDDPAQVRVVIVCVAAHDCDTT
jgi:hypothetical protein